ncbi:MAG TPA: N(4)-(beta-N-acetylglucosaminyl)-L-asparaginase [Candidatus Kapabacteria bacterium]|nr:N(4)-(beta-N-acetylglucosaminyl)-L-asparaginase [Candidatus Kapabacteria bacterium]
MQNEPIILSTWHFGLPANQAGWAALERGGGALDAVEAVARHAESDLSVTSVGKGGLPDAQGVVTLDAAIMDGVGNAGAVACVRTVTNVISLARRVMERSPHVMLVGEGAEQFAATNGFPKENLLTELAQEKFEEHKKNASVGKEMPNEEPWRAATTADNHDTIGVLAQDGSGRIAAACTTSGLAWKMHGRVGDSPIIGAGLFVDTNIGAAVATGTGELVMRTCGTFLIVELMRQGWEPRAACEEAVRRVHALQHDADAQVGFIALRRDGQYATACLREGFEFAIRTATANELKKSVPYLS